MDYSTTPAFKSEAWIEKKLEAKSGKMGKGRGKDRDDELFRKNDKQERCRLVSPEIII